MKERGKYVFYGAGFGCSSAGGLLNAVFYSVSSQSATNSMSLITFWRKHNTGYSPQAAAHWKQSLYGSDKKEKHVHTVSQKVPSSYHFVTVFLLLLCFKNITTSWGWPEETFIHFSTELSAVAFVCQEGTGYIWPLTSLQPQGEWAFLLGKGPVQVPHGFLWVTFQWMHFPPLTIHITLFFWGRFPRMWATAWVGSCPILRADLTLGNGTVSPFSAGQEKYGEGLDLGERPALSKTAEKQLIWIPHHLDFHKSFCTLACRPTVLWLFFKKKINIGSIKKGNNLLVFSGQRPTIAPDSFLRSISKVEPGAQFNRLWLGSWLGPSCTLALHPGPIFLEKSNQGQTTPYTLAPWHHTALRHLHHVKTVTHKRAY